MIRTSQIHPLTDFLRNSKSFTDRIDEEKEPVGLTVNGKVKLVLMDTDTFEELSAIQEQQRFLAAIEEGEKAFEEGKVYPVKEVIAELKAKYGI